MVTSWIALMVGQVPPPPAVYADVRGPIANNGLAAFSQARRAPRSAPPPTPPRLVSGSIGDADYPADVHGNAEGATTVLLRVGINGRVVGCTVTSSSGHSSLDSTTCNVVRRRFRYQPATHDGLPVEATHRLRVEWRLPEEVRIAFAQGRMTYTVTAAPTGVTACRLTLDGPTFVQLGEKQCANPTVVRLVAPAGMAPSQPPVRVSHILSLLPVDEPSTLPRPIGTPVWEEIANFEIASDGSVTACALTSQHGTVPAYVHPYFRPLCETLRTSWGLFSPAAGKIRRARMQSAIFIEVLPRRGP
jgi:TonB family protein